MSPPRQKPRRKQSTQSAPARESRTAPESERTRPTPAGPTFPRQARVAARRDEQRRKNLRVATIAASLVGIALLAYALFGLVGAGSGSDSGAVSTAGKLEGRQMPDQGRDHIAVGQPHDAYNSTPPTSGWHYGDAAPWGIYERPIPDERQVHNLEHGGIMVQYNCPDGCPELVEQLTQVVRRYRSKVILAPYPTMESRIALTAWTRIDQFDQFDEGRIVAFIEAYKDKGPERVPD